MLKTLHNAFKIKDIRRRIWFTLMILVVVRIGSMIHLPGVQGDVFNNLFSSTGGASDFLDAITGGSLSQMSIFALNITPYITSSIIVQLLTIAFPALEEMQRDGEQGRKKMTRITRYLTVGLALGESLAMAIGFGRGGYLVQFNALYVFEVVVALTAGSTILMWLGERITERGVGNGISIVLVINIISRIPQDLQTLFKQFISGKAAAKAVLAALVILAIILAVVIMTVYLQDAERKIPVQYSRKIAGRRSVGGTSSHIPLKVNTGGVIPVIFAQSLMQTPVILAALLGKGNGNGIGSKILKLLSQSHWFHTAEWIYTIGAAIYVVLIIAFAYFYTSITFNPLEIADNIKKQSGFIPGIRPGKPTSDYLSGILRSIILIGAVGLTIVTMLPIIFNGLFNANVSFGGTSLIIIVGVVIETLKQIESQMMVRNYKGFLNN